MGASCSSRAVTPSCEPCAICLDERPTNSVTTACGHQFCEDCITEWVEEHGGSCPTCRAEVKTVTRQLTKCEKRREQRRERQLERERNAMHAREQSQARSRAILRERIIQRAEREALRVMRDAFMRAEIERMRTGSWHHGVSDEEARARYNERAAMRRRRAGHYC